MPYTASWHRQNRRDVQPAELTLELTDIVVHGTAYPILTSDYEVKGRGSGKRSAKRLLRGPAWGQS